MLGKFLNCKNTEECARLILVVLLVLMIQMFLLKYFWNKALVPHITVLKPINTITQALMLAIGLSLVTALA